jgi:hypothetical protein
MMIHDHRTRYRTTCRRIAHSNNARSLMLVVGAYFPEHRLGTELISAPSGEADLSGGIPAERQAARRKETK